MLNVKDLSYASDVPACSLLRIVEETVGRG